MEHKTRFKDAIVATDFIGAAKVLEIMHFEGMTLLGCEIIRGNATDSSDITIFRRKDREIEEVTNEILGVDALYRNKRCVSTVKKGQDFVLAIGMRGLDIEREDLVTFFDIDAV